MASVESTIPEAMRAVQTEKFNNPYVVNTIPVPKPQAHDLLVKVAVASYCHTDAMVNSGAFGTALPATASHEGCGTVVAVGSEVANFKPGDRVMCGLPLHPCMKCSDCIGPEESWRQYCVHFEGQIGVHLSGCMADYAIADSRTSVKVPDGVDLLDAAPLACAGRTVWRGLAQAALQSGDWVVLVGSGGGLGHLAIQFAKAMGLKVVGIDAREQGLELSRHYGADLVLNASDGKDAVVRAIHKVTDNQGADGALVLADTAAATAMAAGSVKMHRTIIQIALADPIEIPFHDVIFRDVRVKGSLIASPGESDAMLEFVARHGIKVKVNTFSIEELEELLELVHSGKLQGKAVVVVDRDQVKSQE